MEHLAFVLFAHTCSFYQERFKSCIRCYVAIWNMTSGYNVIHPRKPSSVYILLVADIKSSRILSKFSRACISLWKLHEVQDHVAHYCTLSAFCWWNMNSDSSKWKNHWIGVNRIGMNIGAVNTSWVWGRILIGIMPLGFPWEYCAVLTLLLIYNLMLFPLQ